MKKRLFILFLIILISGGCIQKEQISCKDYCESQTHIQCVGGWEISGGYPNCKCNFKCDTASSNMANPASVYCEQNGGKIEIITDSSGNQIGYCKFDNRRECEEWSYYKKECSKEFRADCFTTCGNIPFSETSLEITQQELEQGWYYGSLDQKKLGTPDNWLHGSEGSRSAKWYKPN